MSHQQSLFMYLSKCLALSKALCFFEDTKMTSVMTDLSEVQVFVLYLGHCAAKGI